MINHEKFEFDNFPMSDITREGIKKGNLSDALQVLLRAMGMLDFSLEEAVIDINGKIADLSTKVDCLGKDVHNLKIAGRKRDKALEDLKIRVTKVEEIINDKLIA